MWLSMRQRVTKMKPHLLTSAAAAFLILPPSALAQIAVITSGGFRAAYEQLLPNFEKSTGITVTTGHGPSQGDGPDTISAQLKRGVHADVVIMSRVGLNELIAAGRTKAGTDVDLAKVPLGVAVRGGARKPDISAAATVKQALLRAGSVAYESSTVPYVENKLLPRLGIASEIEQRHVNAGAAAVATGQAEIIIAPVSELLHAPGADYVGALPSELQFIQTFSAAIVSGSKEVDVSRRLITFLRSEKAWPAIKASGMEPLR